MRPSADPRVNLSRSIPPPRSLTICAFSIVSVASAHASRSDRHKPEERFPVLIKYSVSVCSTQAGLKSRRICGDCVTCNGNQVFSCSLAQTPGERAAVIYRLVGTAKLNGIDPEAYLRYVLARIAPCDQPHRRARTVGRCSSAPHGSLKITISSQDVAGATLTTYELTAYSLAP